MPWQGHLAIGSPANVENVERCHFRKIQTRRGRDLFNIVYHFHLFVFLSLSLSLYLYLYLSLSLSFHVTHGIQPPQFEDGQVYADTSRVFQPSAPLQISANGRHHWQKASLPLFQLPFFKSSSWDPRRCRAEKIPCWNSWPIESRSITNGSFILLSFRVIYYVSIVTVIS